MKKRILVDKSLACYEGEWANEIQEDKIEQIRKEYLEILHDFRKLIVVMMKDPKTDDETKTYIKNNKIIKKLMGDNEEFKKLCSEHKMKNLVVESGMVYLDGYA